MVPEPIPAIPGDVHVVIPLRAAHALSTWELPPLVNFGHSCHFPCNMEHYFDCLHCKSLQSCVWSVMYIYFFLLHKH